MRLFVPTALVLGSLFDTSIAHKNFDSVPSIDLYARDAFDDHPEFYIRGFDDFDSVIDTRSTHEILYVRDTPDGPKLSKRAVVSNTCAYCGNHQVSGDPGPSGSGMAECSDFNCRMPHKYSNGRWVKMTDGHTPSPPPADKRGKKRGRDRDSPDGGGGKKQATASGSKASGSGGRRRQKA